MLGAFASLQQTSLLMWTTPHKPDTQRNCAIDQNRKQLTELVPRRGIKGRLLDHHLTFFFFIRSRPTAQSIKSTTPSLLSTPSHRPPSSTQPKANNHDCLHHRHRRCPIRPQPSPGRRPPSNVDFLLQRVRWSHPGCCRSTLDPAIGHRLGCLCCRRC